MIPTCLRPDTVPYTYALKPAGLLVVCAWCTPRPHLEALNLAHPGQVSHTMCPACTARFEASFTQVPAGERIIEEAQRARRFRAEAA